MSNLAPIVAVLLILAVFDARLLLWTFRLRQLRGAPDWLRWLRPMLVVTFVLGTGTALVQAIRAISSAAAVKPPSERILALIDGLTPVMFPIAFGFAGSFVAFVALIAAATRIDRGL